MDILLHLRRRVGFLAAGLPVAWAFSLGGFCRSPFGSEASCLSVTILHPFCDCHKSHQTNANIGVLLQSCKRFDQKVAG
ncbi:hypothetical protein C0081_15120 [Cohaesibacter celericrescens]|uniref:Uncharacterized protein n=1 Tax=Cohaesibacter celericrescens TaxID=2067669 RepID=A0A2N5XP03_9HYPH|nr:hypothetical protein C0081_15120 [Cohaesibacter celericrescens]